MYPLTPLQEGILFHHQMSEGSDPYVLSLELRFANRQRLEAYAEALQKVVTRHDILRTSVVWEGLGRPVQVVWRQARLVVEEVQAEEAEPAALALGRRWEAERRRLDVTRAPLMRL